ncbi:MAG TPA: hypothetical protein VFY87_08410, partial [Geminicoccaceae bacterium]|nr:hypothetical protein [Geminicoccaceae bacterium]
AAPKGQAGVVVDLMEALKRSLKDERQPAAAGRAGRKASSGKPAEVRELRAPRKGAGARVSRQPAGGRRKTA